MDVATKLLDHIQRLRIEMQFHRGLLIELYAREMLQHEKRWWPKRLEALRSGWKRATGVMHGPEAISEAELADAIAQLEAMQESFATAVEDALRQLQAR